MQAMICTRLCFGGKLDKFNNGLPQPADRFSCTLQQLPYPDWCRIPDGSVLYVCGCDQASSSDGAGLGGRYQRRISRVADRTNLARVGTDGADRKSTRL